MDPKLHIKTARTATIQGKEVSENTREWADLGIVDRLGRSPAARQLVETGQGVLLLYPLATLGTAQKATLTGIDPVHILITLVCKASETDGRLREDDLYTLTRPSIGRTKLSGVILKSASQPVSRSESFDFNLVPRETDENGRVEGTEMMVGACTPLIPDSARGRVAAIVMQDPSYHLFCPGNKPLGRLPVEVPIGGNDEVALKLVLRTLYDDLMTTMSEVYGSLLKFANIMEPKGPRIAG